jgi:hypothetical protein
MRPGKGAARVTEQFALQQVVRDGGAVNRHKGVIRARTQVVNRAGNHFLSRAAFAGDQDRLIGASDALHQGLDSPHEAMIANKVNRMRRLT